MTIDRLEAYKKIILSKGAIFTVSFTKKNGERRVMNCRLGVKKHLKGGRLYNSPKNFNPIEKLQVIVFDMQKKQYRTINLDTMFALKIGSKEYEVK